MEKPNKEIIREFIERIEIHSDKQVDIYFNFKPLQELNDNLEKFICAKKEYERKAVQQGFVAKKREYKKWSQQQYTHGAIWAIIAEAMLGFGDKATELFRMINPIEHSKTKEEVRKYKVEPYVVAADVYEQKNLAGRGGWTWYTGSSSWMYEAGLHYILGLTIKDGYLSINPCIPKDWKEYKIRYIYKNTTYNIYVRNPNFKNTGVEKMIVNNKLVEDKKIKLLEQNGINNIEIIM